MEISVLIRLEIKLNALSLKWLSEWDTTIRELETEKISEKSSPSHLRKRKCALFTEKKEDHATLL